MGVNYLTTQPKANSRSTFCFWRCFKRPNKPGNINPYCQGTFLKGCRLLQLSLRRRTIHNPQRYIYYRQPGSGNWGFSLRRGLPCLEKWKNIPQDTDILITHGPPLGKSARACVCVCVCVCETNLPLLVISI